VIIHQPETTQAGNEICISARVTYDNHPGDIPDRLWFCYPDVYAAFITDRADTFAVGMLMLAMYLGEDVEVRGTISPRLLSGMQ